ncbi:MAG: sulfatase [Deltaproteobacteria bacterium]|nr:sulfatase [Deltaproteobacteria bacterium]
MHKKLIVLAFILLGAAAVAAYGPWSPGSLSSGKKQNVLIILIDTLRADHLGHHGYERDTSPNLDKFASENMNFSYGVSPSAWTPPSVASLFTGMYASVHGHMPLKEGKGSKFSKLDDSFTTLAEVMKEAGYDTAAISANPLVSEKFGLHQGFNLFVSPGRELAEKVNARTLKYLNDLRPKDKPFFLYVHYMDPHFPYGAPDQYKDMFSGPIKLEGRFKGRQYGKRELRYMGRYDGEIRYVDKYIGEIFSWFKENNLYDDTTIFVVSDHGEQFYERGHLGHADRLYSEETRVPFIVKAAGRREKIDTPVSLVDVFPTVLDITGIKKPNPVNGVSVVSELDKRKREGVLTEVIRHWNQKAFIRGDGRKILIDYPMELGLLLSEFKNIRFQQIFDTNTDFAEVAPLTDESLLSQLSHEFLELYASVIKLRSQYSVGETAADEETINQLKTLGYL